MQPKKDGPAGISLPFEVNRSKAVTDDAVQSLYRTSERGQDGAFPLGTSAQFHSGADIRGDLQVRRQGRRCRLPEFPMSRRFAGLTAIERDARCREWRGPAKSNIDQAAAYGTSG